jgi:hypothetical protein
MSNINKKRGFKKYFLQYEVIKNIVVLKLVEFCLALSKMQMRKKVYVSEKNQLDAQLII